MSNFLSSEKFTEVLREIQKRSMTDPAFRALALKTPDIAFESLAGFPPPAGTKIRFVTEIEEIVVVLPPAQQDGDISDAELASVAAGLVVTPSTLAAQSGGNYGCAS